MQTLNDFGLIGLAVMGQNLVLNVQSRGFAVSVYNRSPEPTREFVAAQAGKPGKPICGFEDLHAFVASLSKPRRVMLMVKAGAPVDAVLDQLIPLLDKDDIVIDGGNSLYADTERRDARLSAAGLRFIGAGVSGGEEGARKGPSIMPGGPASTWQAMQPIFEAIAAKVDGQPCVTHIGPGGAGHYVKMVHNGIEYGDMQLICEAYAMLVAAGFTADEMAAVFEEWNAGELQSYLIEITGKILRQKDATTGKPMVDVILDKAGQKGTGQWTLINAAENAVVVSTINAAVEARVLSSMKAARVAASSQLQGPTDASGAPAKLTPADRQAFVVSLREALYASKIISYAQGLDLMRAMSAKKEWGLELGAIARIWRGGCIIRARFLNGIMQAYSVPADQRPANLMLAPSFRDALNRAQGAWREVVAQAVRAGIAVPAMSASLAYYDAYRSARLPANLLQAQRDFFGAHTYERVDQPAGQWFHTEWPEVIG